MCALAAGAVWCVLSLYLGLDLFVLALPAAAVIGWALHDRGFSRPAAGLLAILLTAVTCLYAQYLLAAARLTGILGLPMKTTLGDMGLRLGVDLAVADFGTGDAVVFVLALALGAWIAARRPSLQTG
jgi:hypothetical protein